MSERIEFKTLELIKCFSIMSKISKDFKSEEILI